MISILPILKCWPKDGGPFVTLPTVYTQDPDTGDRNIGMYRMQIYDGKTTGMHWQMHKVAARHGKRYYETGQADAGGGLPWRRSGDALLRDGSHARWTR